MMPNFLIIALAALIPLVIGFVWYNPKVFGNVWMQSAGLNEDKLKNGNMLLIFGLTYLFSFFLAIMLNVLVIHQYGLFSVLADEPSLKDPNSALSLMIADFMSKYGQNFRTFKHGAFHGVLDTLFFVLPVLGINALFERKNFSYIAVHVGYWMLTLALMGGIICQWG